MRHTALFIPAVLLLASAARAADAPPPPPPLDFPLPTLLPAGKDYPITDFGAVADGATLNTQAIQKAIDACAAAGGGTVVIPKGTFLSGAIFLKKGTNLRIEKDAVLKGSARPADYPVIDSRFEGIERPVMAAFVNALNTDGITVSGGGTIDGSGDQWLAASAAGRGRGPATGPASAPATGPAARGGARGQTFTAPRTVLTPTPDNPPALTLPGTTLMRPRLVCFTNCSNAAIKDLTLTNQAIWCLHILYCTDFLADNLNIKDPTRRVPSSDGIDVDSSRRVRISRTTIDVNDDCISIKAGKDADGRRVNRPSEDILVVDSHMAYGHGGVAMGSEVTGGIRNVEVRDTVIDSDNWAPIRFKSQPTRGGVVENIVYRNIKLSGTRQAFEFNLAWNMRLNTPGDAVPTTVRNVYILNVTGDVRSGGAIAGLANSPITNVVFKDCALTAQTGLRIENARDLDTSGLKIAVQQGEPIFTRTPPATRPAAEP
jgi:polygalacturonase